MTTIIKVPGHRRIEIYGDDIMFISIPGDGPVEVSEVATSGPSGSGLLTEDGFYLLTETSDYIILEA